MPERITDSELEKLKELELGATSVDVLFSRTNPPYKYHRNETNADFAFDIAARNHLPALIAEIQAKREKVVIAESSGEESCDEGFWTLFSCACGCDQIERKHKFCPQCGREISWS